MLSTAELLACHHDAKLRRIPDSGSDRAEQPARPRSAFFRPGLHVMAEPEVDGGRPALACWTRGDVVILTR